MLPIDFELVQDLLLQMDTHKFMKPDGIHSGKLRRLADLIVRMLLVIYPWSWESRKVSVGRKLPNIIPALQKDKKEGPGNYKPVGLTSVPDKVTEKIILGVNEKHLKDYAVIGQS